MIQLPVLIKNKCFCGSTKSFANCCQPYFGDTQIKAALPQTPEQLMRSRFSAYAHGNSQYIYDTYAKTSKALQTVKEINDWSKACKWIALQIHSSTNTGTLNIDKINIDSENINSLKIDIPEQFVEFSAFYISDETLFVLRENSRFVLEQSNKDNTQNDNGTDNHLNLQWRYLDGDIIKHDQIMNLKRKQICPCNNYPTAWSLKKGKKFKQCCANS